MKKIAYCSFAIIIALMSISSSALAQDKWQKMINKAEAAYTTDDYKSANSSLEKFRKKSTKKFGKQNEYTPQYYMLLAKYNLATGLVIDYEANVKTAISNSLLLNKENTLKHSTI